MLKLAETTETAGGQESTRAAAWDLMQLSQSVIRGHSHSLHPLNLE